MHAVANFKLNTSFLDEFRDRQPEWGPLGALVYARTYSRTKEDGTSEEFWETIQRVVETIYTIQKRHCAGLKLPWNDNKAQRSAQEMYTLMWGFKFLPPGRGLFALDLNLLDKKFSSPVFNCAFVSSETLSTNFSSPFLYMMEMLMLGVGVGGDTRGVGKVTIVRPRTTDEVFVVEDSREGWLALVEVVLEAFVGKGKLPVCIDYSQVRPAGAPIKTFGGTASGPGPLKVLIESIINTLTLPEGVDRAKITSTQIVDLFNHIGVCVVSGNVRRAATIVFGEADDEDFLTLKQDETALYSHRWASNNSVLASVGMDYSQVVQNMSVNGEPGLLWLDNAQHYGRMKDGWGDYDSKVMGTNPCVASGTLVDTPYGQHAVDGIQIGDIISTADGFGFVKKKEWHPSRPVVRVEFSNGKSQTVTPAHKYYASIEGCQDVDSFVPVSVRDLDPGSTVMVAVPDAQGIMQHSFTSIVSVSDAGTAIVYDLYEESTDSWVCSGIVSQGCGEITLEDREKCNLCETFPNNCESYDEFKRVLKFAYLYCKTITLMPTHDLRTNAVIMKNRRIGLSMSGIVQAINRLGCREFFNWCDQGYSYINELDKLYSNWLCVPLSIKKTTTKPSGSISCLPGATPGVHHPHSEYYFRRIRLSEMSPLVEVYRNAGYPIEQDLYSPGTAIIVFPIHEKNFHKGKAEVSVWEQMELVAQLQHYWADNSVSATVTFKPEEVKDLPRVLEFYESRLKSVSFLPLKDHGYAQAPYETITKEEYEGVMSRIKPLYSVEASHEVTEKYCDGETCTWNAG